MHDPRLSTALRQLADLGQRPDGSRWRWSIVKVEPIGRIVLPTHARTVLAPGGGKGEARGRCRQVALVLRSCGSGAPIAVDDRGRMYLPVWLRQSLAGSESLVVGTCSRPILVVIAPVSVLDHLGDLLTGQFR